MFVKDEPYFRTLLDVLNEIRSRTIIKCDGIKFLLEEIRTLAPEMAKNGNPVMVVIDDANFLTQGCYLQVYVDPEKIRAYPDQRGLPHWSTRLGLIIYDYDENILQLMVTKL